MFRYLKFWHSIKLHERVIVCEIILYLPELTVLMSGSQTVCYNFPRVSQINLVLCQ